MWCGMVLPECVLYYVTMVLSPVWLKPSRGGYSGNRKMRSSLSASRSRDQQGIRSGDKENGPSPWRSNSSRAPVIPILIGKSSLTIGICDRSIEWRERKSSDRRGKSLRNLFVLRDSAPASNSRDRNCELAFDAFLIADGIGAQPFSGERVRSLCFGKVKRS